MRYHRFDLSLAVCIRFFAVVTLFALVALYFLFQGRYLIHGPEISVEAVPYSVSHEAVELSGTTENISSLYLNGRQINTTDTGSFNEVVTLENGYTIVTLEAVDRYGNRERIERGIVKEANTASAVTIITPSYGSEEKGGSERI